MAEKASITAAVVLILFAVLGNLLLQFFSITISAFKIAGGILIFGVGYAMLHSKEDFRKGSEEAHKEAVKKDDVSIIPLAIPMLSGPGAMTTSIVLMTQANSFIQQFYVILAIIIVSILSYIILSRAEKIFEKIGENGKNVIHKILGLIVVVVGVQFIINGIENSLELWGFI